MVQFIGESMSHAQGVGYEGVTLENGHSIFVRDIIEYEIPEEDTDEPDDIANTTLLTGRVSAVLDAYRYSGPCVCIEGDPCGILELADENVSYPAERRDVFLASQYSQYMIEVWREILPWTESDRLFEEGTYSQSGK